MTTCELSTSVIFAPARCAIWRTMSVPAALSDVATTAHDLHLTKCLGPRRARHVCRVMLDTTERVGGRYDPVALIQEQLDDSVPTRAVGESTVHQNDRDHHAQILP
jgi:hypothetical protein